MGFIWVNDKDNDEKFTKHMEETTKSLEKTKNDLLAEVKELKRKLKEFDGISVEEYNKIKNELKLLKDKSNEGDSDLAKQLKIMQKQLEDMKVDSDKRISILDNENKKLLVDDEINKALIGVNVLSSMMKAARRIIKADVTVVEENGTRKAMIGAKTIKEHIEEWVKSEEGKNFVKADENSGGNSDGGKTGKEYATEVEKYFDSKSKEYNITKQVQVKRKDPELYAKYVKKYKK